MRTMVRFLMLLVAASAAGLFAGCDSTSTVVVDTVAYDGRHGSVEVAAFYSELAPYGEWIDVDPYGWVWTPYGVAVDWRPYTDGHWTYTQHGWTWVSDWSWGWVPFHYGRWHHHHHHGWVWVPGQTWGPAWVDWRYGDGWVGWAPLPPEAAWSDGGIAWHGRWEMADDWWCFVELRWFLESRLRPRVIFSPYNRDLIHRTHRSTNYRFEGDRICNRSLPHEEVEHHTGRPVEIVPVRTRAPERMPSPEARGPVAPRPPVVHTPAVIQNPPRTEDDAALRKRQERELDRLAKAEDRQRRIIETREPAEPGTKRALEEKLNRDRKVLDSWQTREETTRERHSWSNKPRFKVETPKPALPRLDTPPTRKNSAPTRPAEPAQPAAPIKQGVSPKQGVSTKQPAPAKHAPPAVHQRSNEAPASQGSVRQRYTPPAPDTHRAHETPDKKHPK